jgi:hypothetical protein
MLALIDGSGLRQGVLRRRGAVRPVNERLFKIEKRPPQLQATSTKVHLHTSADQPMYSARFCTSSSAAVAGCAGS